jgi:hypothetical protein
MPTHLVCAEERQREGGQDSQEEGSALPAAPAEGVGFEPTGDLTAPSGFQGRCIQPLCHPSGRAQPRIRSYRDAGSSRKGAPNGWSGSGISTLPSSR